MFTGSFMNRFLATKHTPSSVESNGVLHKTKVNLSSIKVAATSVFLRNNTASLILRKYTKMAKPVESSMVKKLEEKFQPEHLEVINESYMHSVPKGSETHFKVVIVSEKFDGLALIKRHRAVNETLKSELESGVHALSIMAKTPEQWTQSGQAVTKSPPCMGGAGL